MKRLFVGIFAALMAPFALLAVLGVLLFLYKALGFMTMPTAENIEARIKQDLPSGTDKTDVLALLKAYDFKHSDYKKVSDFEKSMSDYQQEHIKSRIDLIEYDVGGWRWTASWNFCDSYVQVRFYFNKEGKLIDYTLREGLESP